MATRGSKLRLGKLLNYKQLKKDPLFKAIVLDRARVIGVIMRDYLVGKWPRGYTIKLKEKRKCLK